MSWTSLLQSLEDLSRKDLLGDLGRAEFFHPHSSPVIGPAIERIFHVFWPILVAQDGMQVVDGVAYRRFRNPKVETSILSPATSSNPAAVKSLPGPVLG